MCRLQGTQKHVTEPRITARGKTWEQRANEMLDQVFGVAMSLIIVGAMLFLLVGLVIEFLYAMGIGNG